MKAKSTAILKLFLLTTLCCFRSSAQTSTKDGVVEVPFEFYRNEIIVQVKVDGKGLYNMMLDTGTDPSAIDSNTAREIGLKLASVGHQGTGGGTGVNLAFETKLPSLELGGLAATNVEALEIDLSKTSAALGKSIQGILGHSLLNRRVVQIDYPKRVVRFYSKSPFPKTAERPNVSRRTTLPFRYQDNILIEGVSVNGRRMTANFDTGSNANFQLTPDAVHDLGLEAEVGTAQVSKSVGYNGVAENREGKIKSINVGGITVDEPTVIFFAKGTGRDKKPWGINIGNAFLKDYVVTVDYLSKMITLERP